RVEPPLRPRWLRPVPVRRAVRRRGGRAGGTGAALRGPPALVPRRAEAVRPRRSRPALLPDARLDPRPRPPRTPRWPCAVPRCPRRTGCRRRGPGLPGEGRQAAPRSARPHVPPPRGVDGGAGPGGPRRGAAIGPGAPAGPHRGGEGGMNDALGAPQSVLVLGGSSELARAILRRLVARRARTVILAGRDPERLKEAAAELSTLGAEVVETLSFEATDTASHQGLIDDVFGRHRDIDLVLFAFGTLGTHGTRGMPERDAVGALTDATGAAEVAAVNFAGSVSAGI